MIVEEILVTLLFIFSSLVIGHVVLLKTVRKS